MSLGQPPADVLAVTIGYQPGQTVVRVHGALDLVTAPGLAGLLGGLADQGCGRVVLDLAEVDSMDAAGFWIIVDTSHRLRRHNGVLVLRSPTSRIRKLLDVIDMGGVVEVQDGDDRPRAAANDLGAPADLTPVVPTTHHVVDATLQLVVALAQATVGGADGVSVSLTRHGRLTTMASTDETIEQMDRDQYVTGQGPCLSAAAEGSGFHIESLAEETRWPEFVPRAIDGGIGSILSTPLMASARPVGALNIYARAERAFPQPDQELAAVFADKVSGILTDAGIDSPAEPGRAWLQEALATREVIAQAQGVVMERTGFSPEQAFVALRQSSRRSDLPVRRTAANVVASARRRHRDRRRTSGDG